MPDHTNPITTLPTVISSHSYIDSIQIQQRRYFRREDIEFMQANCGSTHGPTNHSPRKGVSFSSMWLHQPSHEAVTYLSGKCRGIVRIQIALDMITESRQASNELKKYVARTFLLDRSPTEEITWRPEWDDQPSTNASCYFNFQKHLTAGKRAALYADRVSKVTGEPCCHLEIRLQRSKTLTALGIESGLNLLRLDHRRFWERHLTLVETPLAEELGHEWVKTFQKRKGLSKRFPYGGRTETITRIGTLLLRTAHDAEGHTIANDLLNFLRARKAFGTVGLGHLFEKLDSTWLLPPSTNALWEHQKHEENQSLTEHPHLLSLLSCPPLGNETLCQNSS
jgi:hypothetical protein